MRADRHELSRRYSFEWNVQFRQDQSGCGFTGNLEESYIHASIDAFWKIFPQKAFAPNVIAQTGLRGIAGFHRCIAALAGAGNKVIVDTMLANRKWAEDCILVLQPYHTLYVGVQCPLEELERREQIRGDRGMGWRGSS